MKTIMTTAAAPITPSQVASPTLHATVLFTIATFVIMIAISFILEVEIVAKGIGKVIPAARVQVVQAEYTGQIKAIHVKNGDSVQKHQLLIELDSTDAVARLNTVEKEIRHLEIERNRINLLMSDEVQDNLNHKHLAAGTYALFKSTAIEGDDDFYKQQAELLQAEISEIQSSLDQISARIEANSNSKAVTAANMERVKASLTIQHERLESSKILARKGTLSRASYLNVLETFIALKNGKNIHARELEQKTSFGKSLIAERGHLLSGLKSQYLNRKSDIEARLITLREDLVTKRRRVSNTVLKAPASGFVDKLEVFTIGGIAQQGSALLYIVPDDSNPELEVIFPNQDIGFIQEGQQANIKLDAFPSERYGHLKGKVKTVSADATEISENNWGYIVRIQPETTYLKTPITRHKLRSGMTATVDIITGNRTLISYFFAPIIKTIQESLGER